MHNNLYIPYLIYNNLNQFAQKTTECDKTVNPKTTKLPTPSLNFFQTVYLHKSPCLEGVKVTQSGQ